MDGQVNGSSCGICMCVCMGVARHSLATGKFRHSARKAWESFFLFRPTRLCACTTPLFCVDCRLQNSSLEHRLFSNECNTGNQTDQSNFPHPVILWHSMHMIGRFDFLFHFHWTCNLNFNSNKYLYSFSFQLNESASNIASPHYPPSPHFPTAI